MKARFLFGSLGGLAALMGAGFALRKHRKSVRSPALLIGDSLAVGLEKPLQALGLPVHSIAVQGTTVEYWADGDGKAKLQSALASKPGSVFISLGTNDAFVGAQYEATARTATSVLLDRLVQAGLQVFWIGPPKLPSSYRGNKPSQTVIQGIRQTVLAHNQTWLDSADLQIARTDDQLHPTDTAYLQWATFLLEQLGTVFVSPSPVAATPASLGADDSDEEPFPRPAPPTVVTLPSGWVHRKQATAPMRAFAVSVLAQHRPMGDLQTSTIDGVRVGALTEWHWDNHVGGEWKWHRGISLLAPATQKET